MQDIKFLTNTTQSHKDTLVGFFEDADEIEIAVGFLQLSGLENIEKYLRDFCSHSSKRCTFYIGTGFGETDPKALSKLFSILKINPKCTLILCTPDRGIFHPKIYMVRKGNNIKIVTGSANLTEAGWLINDEVSIHLSTTDDAPEYLELKSYLRNLHQTYFTKDIAALINEYKEQLESYQKNTRPPFQFRKRPLGVDGIDMSKLKAYYEVYVKSKFFINVEEREAEYKQAQLNLIEVSRNSSLSRLEFHNLFGPLVGHKGYRKLWHSGSIHRKTYQTLDYIPGFRKVVKLAEQSIQLPISTVYDKMINLKKELRKSHQIKGVGENILAEILMSFDPLKFANLNDNPVAVLSFLGKDFPHVVSFRGTDYKEYVDLLSKIKGELNMRSFLEMDSFFNYLYWNILGR